MNTDLYKRLEEAAVKYADEYAVGDAAFIVNLIHDVAENCFIVGGEWMFNECGGIDMRQLVLSQCKNWWKRGSVWLDLMEAKNSEDLGDLINAFESDMNKLWEEQK